MTVDSASSANKTETMTWVGDCQTGHLQLIDQTLLPNELKFIECRDVESVWEAIKNAPRSRRAGDRNRGGLWVRDWLAIRRRFIGRSSARGCQVSGDQSSDGGQFILGVESDAGSV